jgi:polyisoprenoid-binding protein YceI
MLLQRQFLLTLLLIFATSLLTLQGQSVYRLQKQQQLKVAGTSTLHDWEMVSSEATGQATMLINNNQIQEIVNLKVNLPVKTLKSGNNRLDRVAYSSLDADKHADITYEITKVRSISANQVVAEGNLTVSGQTRPVVFRVNYTLNNNVIQFSGTEKIKFSQFGIAPPTALLGTVKAGDDLTISFDASFSQAVVSR